MSVLVAIGVNYKGYREILGLVEGANEEKSRWSGFLRHLKKRALDMDLHKDQELEDQLESASA